MKQITKKVASKFFLTGENRQELITDDGLGINAITYYTRAGKLIDLESDDIKHLEKKHFSTGADLYESIYDNKTGERLEYLVGIDNLEFLVWFANEINADIEGWDSGRKMWNLERPHQAYFLASKIFMMLQEIAELSDEEVSEINKIILKGEEE